MKPPPPPEGIREAWATIGGHRMRYLTGGSGRPLLLVHGLTAYSFSWRFNLAAFARHSTVYAVDLFGLGFSDRPVLDCSMKATAERLITFLDQLGVGDFDLLGTSHGGAVSFHVAALARARVRHLALAAPANPWSRYGEWIIPACRLPFMYPVLDRLLKTIAFRRLLLRRLYGDPARITAGTYEGYFAPFKTDNSLPHLHRIVQCWESDMDELRRIIPGIADLPTLLLWGDRDVPVPLYSAEPLKAQFRNAQLVVFRGAGHLPYEEIPDEFNRAVTGFLVN